MRLARHLIGRVVFVASIALGALTPAAWANSAPAAPALIWPSSGATINADTPQVFTIAADDPDEDAYTGNVTIRNAAGDVIFRFVTLPAPSGQHSSGTPLLSFPPGSYTWTASATDVHGNEGPQAPSQPFTIAGASDLGGGSVTGSMSFTQPIPRSIDSGSPLTPPACATTAFSVSGFSAAGIATLAQTAFVGPFTFSGSGGSTCETAALGSGSLQLSLHGVGVASATLDCPTLSGGYTRTGTDMHAVLGGTCTINERTDSLILDLRVELVPTGGGGTQPTTATRFDGAYLVSPAT